ncbi:unnamed protein product [Dracunculus medinensis]|uniref:Transmembrane protein 53 n=1 Tax=Dracunculus medinensis TaxID=318479 RepID=A0A3P7QLS3_DRAME|nr:unnamed protein product [Dracunculus medinensis]
MGCPEVERNAVISNGISVVLNEDPNAPLVLLFGWAGCVDRYLAKYSEIYEKQRYSIVRFTADVRKIRSFASYRDFALEIYEKVVERSTTSVIICHLFSMNGCLVFCALWDLIDTVVDNDFIKSKFRGIIFDSSPANVNAWQTATAFSIVHMPPSKYGRSFREIYRIFLASYFSIYRAILWLRSQWESNVYEHNIAYYRLLAISDLPKNQLFIFSSIDGICSANSIAEFARIQEERGAQICKIIFSDTPHCQHLRFHPDEYEHACLNFIKSIVQAN